MVETIGTVEQLARLACSEDRCLAAFDDMLWPAHGMSGVGGDDLADVYPQPGYLIFSTTPCKLSVAP
jgi:hypothetical protein